MKRIFKFLPFILAASLLAACSTGHERLSGNDALLLPMPEPVDPSDQAMHSAVQTFLADSDAPAFSVYDYSRIDLDVDGRRDALVLFRNPYGYWCDIHGCALLVLKADNESFKVVNAIQPIREPLYVSDQTTNGWKDLIVRVSGRWDKAKDVAMTYDGRQYPATPASLPPYMRLAANQQLRLFYNEGT